MQNDSVHLPNAFVAGLVVACLAFVAISFIGWMLIAATVAEGISIAKGELVSIIPLIGERLQMGREFLDWAATWPASHAEISLRKIRMVVSVGLGLGAALWYFILLKNSFADRHIEGSRLLKGREARREFARYTAEECTVSGDGLRIHPTLPPLSIARERRHIVVFGGLGGGKTQTILPLILAAVERGDRMFVYDQKGDYSSYLKGVLFAPWDARSPIWAIAEDVETTTQAVEFAARIVPEGKSSAPMWHQAARQILTGCIVELQVEKAREWGFEDLVQLASRPAKELKTAFERYYPEAIRAVEGANVTTSGILINLSASLGLVYRLAEDWPVPKKNKTISVRRFLEGDSKFKTILLPGNGEYKELARAFISAVIGLASQWVASPLCGESDKRRLWFFLDEFPQMGKLESVLQVMEVGRSKGVRVVLGLQDLAQMRAVYSQDNTDSMLSMSGTTIVARVSRGDTADWITNTLIGKSIVSRYEESHTSGGGTPGRTVTSSWKEHNKDAPLAAELEDMLGPDMKGVRILFRGFKDALVLHLPFTSPPIIRKAFVAAAWTRPPPPNGAAPDAAAEGAVGQGTAIHGPTDVIEATSEAGQIAEQAKHGEGQTVTGGQQGGGVSAVEKLRARRKPRPDPEPKADD